MQLKGGSHDVLFDGNRFQDVTSDAGTIAMGDGCDSTCDIDPNHYAAVRVHAINNVMVRVGRGFDVQGCKDCAVLVEHHRRQRRGQRDLQADVGGDERHDARTPSNARIVDNIIANPTGNVGNVMQINGAAGQGLHDGLQPRVEQRQAVNWGDGHPTSADTHSVTSDPKFTSADGDYTLGAGSAAIGAGTNLFNDVPHDILGAARPSSGAFDIGAYQSH